MTSLFLRTELPCIGKGYVKDGCDPLCAGQRSAQEKADWGRTFPLPCGGFLFM